MINLIKWNSNPLKPRKNLDWCQKFTEAFGRLVGFQRSRIYRIIWKKWYWHDQNLISREMLFNKPVWSWARTINRKEKSPFKILLKEAKTQLKLAILVDKDKDGLSITGFIWKCFIERDFEDNCSFKGLNKFFFLVSLDFPHQKINSINIRILIKKLKRCLRIFFPRILFSK